MHLLRFAISITCLDFFIKVVYINKRKLTSKKSEMLWRKLIFYHKPPWFPNFNDKFYSGCYPANSGSEPETSKPNSAPQASKIISENTQHFLKMTKFMLKLLKTETYLVLFKERKPKHVEFTTKACTNQCSQQIHVVMLKLEIPTHYFIFKKGGEVFVDEGIIKDYKHAHTPFFILLYFICQYF